MIVTIDGPAGAGKSSIAHQVAHRLGFDFLDTGAMYRAVTFGALRGNFEMHDTQSLIDYVQSVELVWDDDRIYLDGVDVSEEIRTPHVTRAIHFLADIPEVRELLSQLQRRLAEGRDIVTEGRDQGSDVFPDANCKVFLTASPEERARRRFAQLAMIGRVATFEEILETQNQRDLEDSSREVGRLRIADDAVVVNTDGMSSDEVLDKVLAIVRVAIDRCEVKNG